MRGSREHFRMALKGNYDGMEWDGMHALMGGVLIVLYVTDVEPLKHCLDDTEKRDKDRTPYERYRTVEFSNVPIAKKRGTQIVLHLYIRWQNLGILQHGLNNNKTEKTSQTLEFPNSA